MEDQRLLLHRSLIRVNDKLSKSLKRNLEQFNLSGPEYGIIRNLGGKALTLSELSQRLLKVNSNTTMMVDVLEAKCLVRRERDDQDRRVVRVGLTPAGERLRAEVVPDHSRYIRDFLAEMDDDEVSDFLRLLGRLEEICDKAR